MPPPVSQASVVALFQGNMEQLLAEAQRRRHTVLKEAVSGCMSSRYEPSSVLKALVTGCEALRHTKLALLCIGDIGKLASMRIMPLPLSHSIPLAAQTLQRLLDPIDEELQLRLVQTLVALVSACDTREAYIAQPLSAIFSLFCSSRFAIVQAACSATITQTSHALLSAFYMARRPSETPTSNGKAEEEEGGTPSLGGQLLAASYYKDVCAMCAGLTPKWIRLEGAPAPHAPPGHSDPSSLAAAVIPMPLRFLLLDVLAQHLTDSKEVDPETHSPLLTQCLNEDLVTLTLTCSPGGPHGPHGQDAALFQDAADFFTRVQRVAVAALVHARKCMRHTAPAILNHHTMVVLDAASYPWKTAIVLSLWRKQLSDFTVLENLLEVGRDDLHGGGMMSSGSVTPSGGTRSISPSGDTLLLSGNPRPATPHHHHQPHSLPLVTLVQAASSLLNHIIEAGCASVSPTHPVKATNRADDAPSPQGGLRRSVPQQPSSPGALAHNNSFSTLSNTLELESSSSGAVEGGGGGNSAEFLSSVSAAFHPMHHEAHPATEFVGTVLDFITMVTQSLARSLDVASGATSSRGGETDAHSDVDHRRLDPSPSSSSLRSRHVTVMQLIGPKLLQSCSLAMRHLVGEDIIHSVLKCATHCIHCCSVLQIDTQRDAFLHVLAQQVIEAPDAPPASCEDAGRAGAPNSSRGTSPIQLAPVASTAVAHTTPSTTPMKNQGDLRSPPGGLLQRGPGSAHSLASSVTSGSAVGRSAVKDFLSNSERVERRVLVLSSLISIASAMGARLGCGGWRIVLDCFLVYSELMDEVPRLLRKATYGGSSSTATTTTVATPHHGPSGGGAQNAVLGSSTTSSSSAAAATTGWVGMMSQTASNFFYGLQHNHNANAGGGSTEPSQTHQSSSGPTHSSHAQQSPPHNMLREHSSSHHFHAVTGVSELQLVIDSLVPLHEAISDIYRGSAFLPEHAALWLVRATIERSLRTNQWQQRRSCEASELEVASHDSPPAQPRRSSGSSSVNVPRTSRVRFASRCLTVLLLSQVEADTARRGRRQEEHEAIPSDRTRRIMEEVENFFRRLFTETLSATDASTLPLGGAGDVTKQQCVPTGNGAAALRGIVDDICHVAAALLPMFASSFSSETTRTDAAASYEWMLAPLELLEDLYVQLSHGVPSEDGLAAVECSSYILHRAYGVISDAGGLMLPSAVWGLLIRFLGHSCDVGEVLMKRPAANTTIGGRDASPAQAGSPPTTTANVQRGASASSQHTSRGDTGATSSVAAAVAEDIMFAFRCLESVQHSHLQSLGPDALEALVHSGERFMLQHTTFDKMSVNLSAVQLLWSVGDYLVGDTSQSNIASSPTTGPCGGGAAVASTAAAQLWSFLLESLRNGCLDGRQEVRHAAVKSLFSLVVTHGGVMPGPFWFPFLSSTLKVLMETVRAAVAQREVELTSDPSPVDLPPRATAAAAFADMATPPKVSHRSAQPEEPSTFYALTPNRRIGHENPLYREHLSNDCMGNVLVSENVVRLVEHLAVHPKQLDEMRVLLLEFISRLFRVHHGQMVAALSQQPPQLQQRFLGGGSSVAVSSAQGSANASFVEHDRSPSADTAPAGHSNGGSSVHLHAPPAPLRNNNGNNNGTPSVLHHRLREFLALCGTLQAQTWETRDGGAHHHHHRASGDSESTGLPEEVGIATVKAIFSLIGELVPFAVLHGSELSTGGPSSSSSVVPPHVLLDVSDVEAAWSILESVALSAPTPVHPSLPTSHQPEPSSATHLSTAFITPKVLSLIVESLGAWMLAAVKARSVSHPLGDHSTTCGRSASTSSSAAAWYPCGFVSTYLQRLVGVWDACSHSKAALVSYYYPSAVQSSILSVAQQFAHGPISEQDWHTVCGFLVGQMPSRACIEQFLFARHDAAAAAASTVPQGGGSSAMDALPPLGTHLNYVQRVAQLLFEGVTLCSPWVSSWLAPLVLRPVGCLLALSLRRPSLTAAGSNVNRLSVPAGFFDELMAIIETLCWGVVFQRSVSQRSITAAVPPATPLNLESCAEPVAQSSCHRSAPQATKDFFAREIGKRRDFLHAFTAMLGHVISVAAKIYEDADTHDDSDVGDLQYIEVLVRWVGELVQDSVCTHDTLGASELLTALVPASSLTPAPLRRVTHTACLVMNVWAAGDQQQSQQGAALPSSKHRRTESTALRLQEATDTIASLQSIARATMGSRNRGVIEAFVEEPHCPGNRELLVSALAAMGAPKIACGSTRQSLQEEEGVSEDDRASLRATLPLLLSLVRLDDSEVRCLAADAVSHSLVRLGVIPAV